LHFFYGSNGQKKFSILSGMGSPTLRIGTSAFTAAGWPGSLYPEGMQPRDFLSYYATKFDTVEVDSTFYRTPSASTVRGWYDKTPKSFVFSLKVPQVITHEKCLEDCEDDLGHFLKTVELLREKLGPILFQFGYFNKKAFKSEDDFLVRLTPFLKKLPKGLKFALEIRNKSWLNEEFAEVLRERGIALALIDQSWVPRPWEFKKPFDMVTADFNYVRLLGDRKGIEEITKSWDKVVVNRAADIRNWVKYLRPIVSRGEKLYVYCNNHYAGHGPATVAQFLKAWNA
jgi:uncharacterized protein YecE (DUF72 family)